MSEIRAAAEWRRSLQCLAAARLCQGNGLYADAISRAYYAVMHAAKAVLELHNIQVDSHEGVKNLFGYRVVMTRLIEGRWGREIDRLYRWRIRADYTATEVFSESDARSACDRAEAFVSRIRLLLPDSLASSV